jgi:hypothetical protein
MLKTINWAMRLCCTGLVAGTLLLAGPGASLADPPSWNNRANHSDRGEHRDRGDRGNRGGHSEQRDHGDRADRVVRVDRSDRGEHRDRGVRWSRDDRDGHRDRDRHYTSRDHGGDHYRSVTKVIYQGRPYVAPHHRTRRYRDVLVVRPYGYWYPGYGYYDHDDDAYKWLSFTAIALKLLDNLNEQQQREHEAAQIAATTAPIGETIIWREGGASGAVTATREGTTPSGRYCREFLQEVTIGGRKEEAYGTACRQPDGAWEVISVDRP